MPLPPLLRSRALRAALPIVGLAALLAVLVLRPPATELPPLATAPDPRPRLDPAVLTGPEPDPRLPTAVTTSAEAPYGGPMVVVRGSGWGHSVGMSQYGAQAQALAGRSHHAILEHYYPGTQVEPHEAAEGAIRVGLFRNQPVSDAERLELRTAGRGGQVPARPIEVALGDERIAVPAGETWTIERPACGEEVAAPDCPEGGIALIDATGETRAIGQRRAVVDFSFLEGAPTLLGLPQLSRSGAPLSGLLQWGHLEVSFDEDGEVLPVLVLPFELYMRGLAEMPASWHPEALAAQALAGRTFAVRQVLDGLKEDCACHLGTTPHDQVYAGWEKEGGVGGDRWRGAVAATAGHVVTFEGELAWTYYSSSHGGRTEASEDSWAYDESHPYLVSVDDPWSLAGGIGNPMASWERQLPAEDFAHAVGLVSLDHVAITERTAGGSPAVLEVSGRDVGGNEVSYEFRGWRTGVAGSDLKLTFRSELPSQQLTDIRLVGTDEADTG